MPAPLAACVTMRLLPNERKSRRMTDKRKDDRLFLVLAVALFVAGCALHIACGDFAKGIDVLPDERRYLEIARSLGLTVTTSKVCGGGAKSPLWRRILANVMNLTLEIPAVEEGPALGGAMLAAVACGEYPDVEAACAAIVRTKGTVEPEPELVAKYEEKYQVFRKLYPALKGIL